MGISVPTTPGGGGVGNVLQVARATATTDQALSGTPTIDDVALSATNRVLLTGQSSAAENGLWVAAAGAWTRPSDYAAGATIQPNVVVPVAEGTTNGDTRWQITDDGAVVVDTDPTTWGKTNLGLVAVVDDLSPVLGGNLDCDAKEVTDASKLSVGIATAARKVEILDATNPQLRLTHTDNTEYVELQSLSTGDAVIQMTNKNLHVRSGDVTSYVQIQNTTSGHADGTTEGLSVGCNGISGYLWMRNASSTLGIGVAGNAIAIDATNNTSFLGSVTLGDTGDAIHTVNGGATLQRNATSYVLTGSIDPAASTTVPGVLTKFLTELVIGDRITVSGETRRVTAIASNTSLTVDTAFSDNPNDTSPDRLPAHLVSKDGSGNVELIVTDESNVGIGTIGPDRKLEVLDDTNPQLRLTHTDSAQYLDTHIKSTGDVVLYSTGRNVFLRGDSTLAGADRCYFVIQNATTTFSDSPNKGLVISTFALDAAFNMQGSGATMKLGVNNGWAIKIDASNNTSVEVSLSVNGNVTLGDAGTDEHTLNGTLNLDSAPADLTCSGTTATFIAGETVDRGDVCYFKADGKMWKALASAAASSRAVAIAAEDITGGGTGRYLLRGFIKDTTTFPTFATVGGVIYTDDTAGPPTQTAPSDPGDFVQVIGWAVDGDTVYFDPNSTIIELV